MDLGSLERYRDIVDDWSSFAAALAEPLPTCLVTNELRITTDELAARLQRRGVALRRVPWTDDVLISAERGQVGSRFEYLTGLYNVQEEAAVIPVKILDPQPGERILDMCAAPGNKTAQIALAMRNRGTVVANDRSYQRMRATRGLLDRFGLANVCLTIADAANYPNVMGGFDRVLADVPCSCEGTSRKSPTVLEKAALLDFETLGKLQRAILRRAFDLCRPGGRVVYSTCAYSPEENEAVVHAVLQELPYDVAAVACELPGFQHAPALTSYRGTAFDPRVAASMRVWPHHNDTGGFYVAAFDKSPEAPAAPPVIARDEALAVSDTKRWLAPFRRQFGWEDLDEWVVHEPNVKTVWLANSDTTPVPAARRTSVGIGFIRKQMGDPKPTTTAAMLLGPRATRGVAELDERQMDAFLRREDVVLRGETAELHDRRGYVLLRCQGIIAGLGRFRRDGRTIESLYPGAWALDAMCSAFEGET